MNDLSQLTYGIVGLGMMGGSFAKAARAKLLSSPVAELAKRKAVVAACGKLPTGSILALDRDAAVLRLAREDGVIDQAFAPEDADVMLALCDIVFVCLYPSETVRFLEAHRGDFRSGALITDIAGVKAGVMAALPRILRTDTDFICGHPMAGSEKEGYAHASAALFEGRNYILMPHAANRTRNIALFKDLAAALGFARITETDWQSHDRKIAFTSQLCHVIAAALVDSAEDAGITAFGGGSFEDLTRIAMINAPLWTELFLANREELLFQIEAFIASLDSIAGFIDAEDADALRSTLEAVRTKRTAMSPPVN